jgi:hypothetical protein
MKKKAKKLSLHRETLRTLRLGRLEAVVGGSMNCSEHTFCVTDCPWCPGDTYTNLTACERTCGC